MNNRMVAAAAAGAAVGLGVGYAVFALSNSLKFPFLDWLIRPDIGAPMDALIWAILGAVAGGGIWISRRPQS